MNHPSEPRVTEVLQSSDPTRTQVVWAERSFSAVWEAVQHAGRVGVVYGSGVRPWVQPLLQCAPSHLQVEEPLEVVDGEAAKSVGVLSDVWDYCGRSNLGRRDVLISLGGGSVTDLVGFAAATWMRGIGVVHVPTTVLGMVDAAIGGKTGINTVQGKNMAGAFHAPLAVVCCQATLSTLPLADVSAGMAEVIKAGWIADPSILDVLSRSTVAGSIDEAAAEAMWRAVRVKADVVSRDFREGGLRETLNYGHTFGHAVEKASDYRLRHGEAVAIGMTYAAHLAQLLGVASTELVDQHIELLQRWRLPTTVDSSYAWPTVRRLMGADKKNRGSGVRFVLVPQAGQTQVMDPVPEDALLAAALELGVSESEAPR